VFFSGIDLADQSIRVTLAPRSPLGDFFAGLSIFHAILTAAPAKFFCPSSTCSYLSGVISILCSGSSSATMISAGLPALLKKSKLPVFC